MVVVTRIAPRFSSSWSVFETPRSTQLTPSLLKHQAKKEKTCLSFICIQSAFILIYCTLLCLFHFSLPDILWIYNSLFTLFGSAVRGHSHANKASSNLTLRERERERERERVRVMEGKDGVNRVSLGLIQVESRMNKKRAREREGEREGEREWEKEKEKERRRKRRRERGVG